VARQNSSVWKCSPYGAEKPHCRRANSAQETAKEPKTQVRGLKSSTAEAQWWRDQSAHHQKYRDRWDQERVSARCRRDCFTREWSMEGGGRNGRVRREIANFPGGYCGCGKFRRAADGWQNIELDDESGSVWCRGNDRGEPAWERTEEAFVALGRAVRNLRLYEREFIALVLRTRHDPGTKPEYPRKECRASICRKLFRRAKTVSHVPSPGRIRVGRGLADRAP